MDNNTLAIYINELRNQCINVEASFNLFNQALANQAGPGILYASQMILVPGSQMAAMLWPTRARSRNRGEALRKVLQLPEKHALNDRRLAALSKCRADAGPDGPTVEAIIDAFLEPMLAHGFQDDPGWRHYFELVGQVNSSIEWGGVLMTKYFDPLVREFIEALRDALPNAEPEDLYWSYHFLSVALTLTFAHTGRISQLSDGVVKSEDMLGAYKRMVPCVSAGF